MKTQNGRPAKIGSMYFEHYDNGGVVRKFTLCYCPSCKRKIGLTPEELNKFAENMPGLLLEFISRLVRLRVILPR
ncbi:MAG: hypothetical protein ACKKMS_00215 [Candidatus Nealsonbacteria bacterium]